MVASPYRGALWAEITPVEPDPVRTGEGSMVVPRCLTIAGSDSGGGAGIQADLKAFAAAGCHGMSAIVALTAQNTVGVTAVHEAPPDFIRAQLEAVFSDLGVDAAKTGMLFSRASIETVADFIEQHRVPLVVDPVMLASSGARLLQDDAVSTLVSRLFPLATVVTPNLDEAEALAGVSASRRELAERIHELGALPVMAHAREEVEEMVALAGALVLNIGTLSPHWVESMIAAGKAANASGIPVVLDPVGAGATRYRTDTAKRILAEVDVTVLRGNQGEVATLVGVDAEVRGVESLGAGDDPAGLARMAGRSLGLIAAVTGVVDHVS